MYNNYIMRLYRVCKILSIVVLVCKYVYAWEDVGHRVYTSPIQSGSSVTMTYSSDGNLFILYSATNNNSFPTMEKYIESTNEWKSMDMSFFQQQGTTTRSMWNRIAGAIDGNGESVIYFAYNDTLYQNGLGSMAKYDSITNSWGYVGNRGFTSGPVGYMWMQIKNNKTPYVLFPDKYYDGGPLSMMMFDGESWQYVGKRGFSSQYENGSGAAFTFDSSNWQPYVIFSTYTDDYPSGSVRVMTYVNESWVDVGNPNTGWGASNNRIAVDSTNHHVYIAYEDGNFVNVMMYDGKSWATIGYRLSDGNIADDSFFVDPVNHYVYLAFVDKYNNNSITAKKYNGEQWIVVDEPNFTPPASEVTGTWDSKHNAVVYAFPVITDGSIAKVMRSTPQENSKQAEILYNFSYLLPSINNNF